MDNLKNFYEVKVLTLEDFENEVCLEFDDLDAYLHNYEKIYKVYDLLESDKSKESKEKILANIKALIESKKDKIKDKLNSLQDNVIEVSTEYYNFITYLSGLKKKYPLFKEVIIIDDIV